MEYNGNRSYRMLYITTSKINYNDSNVDCIKNSLMIPFLIEMNSDASVPAFIITSFGLLGNFITIMRIGCDKILKSRPTYVVIALLALADFTCLTQYISHVFIIKFYPELNNDAMFMTLHYGVTHLSAAHVVYLLGLRYYILVHPLVSRSISIQRLLLVSAVVWVSSVIFAAVYYFIRFMTCLDTFSTVIGFRSYLLIMPCVIILILHMMKIRKIGHSIGNEINQVKSMSRMIFVILIIYISSASLFPICFIFNATKLCPTEEDCAALIILARVMWLFNNSANPAIYFFFSPPIYKRLQRVRACCWKKTDFEIVREHD